MNLQPRYECFTFGVNICGKQMHPLLFLCSRVNTTRSEVGGLVFSVERSFLWPNGLIKLKSAIACEPGWLQANF